MIRSMTAFAGTTRETAEFSLSWEIRSVNHRYLEIKQRLPEALRDMENAVREACRNQLERGKVDISLRYAPAETTTYLNKEKVQQLADLSRQIGDVFLHAGTVSPLEVMHLPGVLSSDEPDLAPVKTTALELLDAALQELVANREREGATLKQFLEQRLDGVENQVAMVREALPNILSEQRDKARELAQSLAQTDPERLEQALVELSRKMDVDEELDRLEAHIKEMHYQLDQPPASGIQQKKSLGRRLDFLMQEFNREANTLGSKSAHLATTNAAVELKVLIEQMREQIQNIE